MWNGWKVTKTSFFEIPCRLVLNAFLPLDFNWNFDECTAKSKKTTNYEPHHFVVIFFKEIILKIVFLSLPKFEHWRDHKHSYTFITFFQRPKLCLRHFFWIILKISLPSKNRRIFRFKTKPQWIKKICVFSKAAYFCGRWRRRLHYHYQSKG